MLSPETRAVAMDFLRPPVDYTLDQAVLTTYTLNLEALLAVPLAVLAHADGGLDEVLADPLLLLEALREAGDRIHVFVDEGGISTPRVERNLYAMLESSVHPVRAPNGGIFHPKLWLARFASAGRDPLLRVAVLSRNLTFDRSWDVALTSEASPSAGAPEPASRGLGELLRGLPEMAVLRLPQPVISAVAALAAEAERCSFPGPKEYSGVVEFQALGVSRGSGRLWLPREDGSRLLAISPFLSPSAAIELARVVDGKRTLISRQDALDGMPADALEQWDEVYVLAEAAAAELDDELAGGPDSLHAKLIAIEHVRRASWYVGSANLTDSGVRGRNVEFMASATAGKWRNGIDKFVDSGFLKLCEPYRRVEREPLSSEVVNAQAKLDAVRNALLAENALRIECAPDKVDWEWRLIGNVAVPPDVDVAMWPVSLDEQAARQLLLPVAMILPADRLTAFVAFRLGVPGVAVDDVHLTLLLPSSGMPENRMSQVLKSLIDSPERLFKFLRALLGGLDGLVDWAGAENSGEQSFNWASGIDGESLLEDLVRVAARDPERLKPVRRLIEDLLATDGGRAVLTDELLQVWNAVDAAIDEGGWRDSA